MNKETDCYVYAYLDPSKPGVYGYEGWEFPFEPFYVGKGKNGRILSCLNGDSFNVHLNNRIRSVKRKGFNPIPVHLCCGMTDEEALKEEKRIIVLIGRRDQKKGSLVNHNEGGGGNGNPSKMVRRKISNSLKSYFEVNGYHETTRRVNQILTRKRWDSGEFDYIAKMWKGEGNPWYGKDTSGSKNQHALYCYIACNSEGELFFIPRGNGNLFARKHGISEWVLRNSAKIFSETGELRKAQRTGKWPYVMRTTGWCAVRVNDWIDPDVKDLDNQQLSELWERIKSHGLKVQRLSRKGVGHKRMVVEMGNGLEARSVI